MTNIKGEATMELSSHTTSTELARFLTSLPEGKISIYKSQPDRYYESTYTTLTVKWEYDLSDRMAEDRREMMGT